jgi:hypothetical protein
MATVLLVLVTLPKFLVVNYFALLLARMVLYSHGVITRRTNSEVEQQQQIKAILMCYSTLVVSSLERHLLNSPQVLRILLSLVVMVKDMGLGLDLMEDFVTVHLLEMLIHTRLVHSSMISF